MIGIAAGAAPGAARIAKSDATSDADAALARSRRNAAAVPLADAGFETPAGVVRVGALRCNTACREPGDEDLVDEAPIALEYNGEVHAVMMATPLDLEDFAAGFSLSEGHIDSLDDIAELRVSPQAVGAVVHLRIAAERLPRLAARRRGLEGRSGCGLCGLQSIEAVLRPPRRVSAGASLTASALQNALSHLADCQPLNALTGAAHAAAFARSDGTLLAIREDVGRHNALDKLIGALARGGIAPQRGFAIVTSRASHELVFKAAQFGIHTLAAISAPTAAAVSFADEAGMTLIGFARERRCTVYTRAGRLR